MQGSTPMRRGEDVILFLLRDRDAPAKDRWTFSPFGGYGLLANHGKLVFSYPVRGVPIEKFRDDVMLCERMRFRPGRGVLMGRVLHAGSSAPIAGVAVRVEGSEATSQSNSEGWFQLFDLPIGQRMLFAKDSLGDVSAPVGVTDETVDSLELRVAQPGDPDTAPPAREGSAVNARAQRGTRFEGFRLPYDIPPMPYQRSDPG